MTDPRTRLAGLDHDGLAGLYGGIVALSDEAALSLGSMEGIGEAPREAISSEAGKRIGYLLAGLIGVAAYGLHYLPMTPFSLETASGGIRRPIGAAIIAILLGVLVANLTRLPGEVLAGAKSIVRSVIPWAIVCVGAGLNLIAIGGAGVLPLVVIFSAVIVAYATAYFTGRCLGLTKKTSALLGVGTGVCGSSAIVAAAPLLDAEDEDLVLSVGTVNLLGLVVMLLLPLLAPLLAMSETRFGVWCGATIHAVPQVLTAGDAYFQGGVSAARSLEWATLIKLGRVAMLVPIILVLAVCRARGQTQASGVTSIRYHQLVPWFIWGFIIMATLGTMGWLPLISFKGSGQTIETAALVQFTGKLLLTYAMAAIGLGVNLRLLMGVGGRAVVAGTVSSLVLVAVMLALVVWLF